MNELAYVRDLIKKYAEIATSPDQEEKRKLWKDLFLCLTKNTGTALLKRNSYSQSK